MNDGTQLEMLSGDNYDTWKIHVEALLVKRGLWEYVSGEAPKPSAEEPADIIKNWTEQDRKAKADILLSMKPSELRQIKNCVTSRDVWMKLEDIYQSKGPAQKVMIIKNLLYTRMKEGDDIRSHVDRFSGVVDKLNEFDIKVNNELLVVILLYSLPTSYENFRCAVESRDELPDLEQLKIKIVEEGNSRKNVLEQEMQDAVVIPKQPKKPKQRTKHVKVKSKGSHDWGKIKCFRCQKFGHMAKECPK